MTTETIEISTTELLSDASETVKQIYSAQYYRHKLLRKAGLTMGATEEYSKARELNGHSALIGAHYKTIRRACEIPLETMADKCDITTAELRILETCGFITVAKGKYWHVATRDSLVKDVYTGVLRIALWNDDTDSEELYFEDMVELNKAYTSDIEESLWLMEHSEPAFVVNSYKNILKAYAEIDEILAPCLEL